MNTNDWISIRYGLRHTGYRLFENSPRRVAVGQRGAILPLVAIGMGALLAMGGLALDMGHGYLNKTRLQNALDAAALSGAKTLDETKDTGLATTAARAAFGENAKNDAGGNKELSQNIAPGNVLVEFSETLNPFGGGANPRFVRVGVSAANFATPSWLLQTIGVANVNVGARAVAGPSPALTCPEILPVAPCGTPGAVNYGYKVGQEVTMKTGSGNGSGKGVENKKFEVGPGNYQNVDLDGLPGGGGRDIRENMAGAFTGCASPGQTIKTKPGDGVGPNAQGLNTRFDCPTQGEGEGGGACKKLIGEGYKPDVVTATGISYSQYMSRRANHTWDLSTPYAQFEPPRRLAAVPVINCTGTENGQGSVTVLGLACMFLTKPAEQKGDQEIYGEFLGTSCIGRGSAPGSNPAIGPGPHTIILYKDFRRPDEYKDFGAPDS